MCFGSRMFLRLAFKIYQKLVDITVNGYTLFVNEISFGVFDGYKEIWIEDAEHSLIVLAIG